MLTIRQAIPEDAVSLAPRLREADLKEIQAVHLDRSSPEHSLMVGVRSPDGCYVAVDEQDVPQIIFGTYPSSDPMVGFIWMMATDGLTNHRLQLFRETKVWLKQLGEKYSLLTNLAHSDNLAHIQWLQWAGFTILRTVPFNGHSFYEFAYLCEVTGNHV